MKKSSLNPKLYTLNKHFLIHKLGGKTALFDAASSKLFTLNETSQLILTGIQLNWDKEKILKKITVKFPVQESVASKDIDECIQGFIDKKIIILKGEEIF